MSHCIIKRFVLKRLNGLLDDRKESIAKARSTVELWTGRCKSLCGLLESLSAKLEDNTLTDDELKSAVDDIQAIIREW